MDPAHLDFFPFPVSRAGESESLASKGRWSSPQFSEKWPLLNPRIEPCQSLYQAYNKDIVN